MKDASLESSSNTDMSIRALNTVPMQISREYAENSTRVYSSHIKHFRFTAGKLLPSDFQGLADYLLAYGATLAPSTLAQRVSALSKWHREQGFNDPTKDPRISQLLAHIKNHSSHKTNKASPLLIHDLKRIDTHMSLQFEKSEIANKPGVAARIHRDRAMLLIAFWLGLSLEQVASLKMSDIAQYGDGGFILSAKITSGRTIARRLPVRHSLCPTRALENWLQMREICQQKLFYNIDRWGNTRSSDTRKIHMREALQVRCEDAGWKFPFSGLSLKRGFEQWAKQAGWDIQSIHEYVGLGGIIESMLPLIQRTSPEEIERCLNEV